MSFSSFTEEEKETIKYVISDVDDTITTDGALLPGALDAMYRLKESGKTLILVTGGSAGWADAYIRQWPVDAVIAESGAVLLMREDGNIRYYMNPMIEEDPETMVRRSRFMEENGRYRFSSDQYARIFDVAYEKSGMEEGDEEALLEKVEDAGATALVSSIHVNVLFAPLSKAIGIKTFFPKIKEVLMLDAGLETFLNESLSMGDSTNDEALFEMTRYSVGNKRVADSRAKFSILPTWITDSYGGNSFSKVISKLLSKN